MSPAMDRMQQQVTATFRQTYGREPTVIARAPGRLEFIGNHTDYNGGPVLGAALDRGLWVALAPREDGVRRWRSGAEGEIIETSLELLKPGGTAAWINYPQGVLAAMDDHGFDIPGGFDLAVESDLPAGAGLSSSAAIELAAVLGFTALTGQEIARELAVVIARQAENDFVGVPCGILDQGVSGFGQADHLVHIDCLGPSFSTVPLPTGLHFWVFNTHTKHALTDGYYRERHEECMAAAQVLGATHLAQVSMDTFHDSLEQLSRVQAKRARHVIEETLRVKKVVRALETGDTQQVGRLLTSSHRSSQMFFDNSTPELDLLVDTLTRLPGVHGARLTGGGFGGAVMALTDGSFGEADADVVVQSYRGRWDADPEVLHLQTGPGAEVVVRPD